MTTEEVLPLSDADYLFVVSLLYDRFGIQLGSHKRILVAGRLTKRVRQLNFNSFSQYLKYLRDDPSGSELSEFINRLTTNHSYFYREKDHFDILQKMVFPELRGKLQRDSRYQIRIWSAGCAMGEEVYTLALILREFFGAMANTADIGLLATDISMAVLKAARAGLYADQKLSELPIGLKSAYFRKAGPDLYEISEEIKRMVLFKRLNLMAESYPFKNPFDVIFCRNVMIYFDQASRSRLVHAFHKYLKPGGYLFIGHSETIPRTDCPFDYVQPAVYRKGSA